MIIILVLIFTGKEVQISDLAESIIIGEVLADNREDIGKVC